MNMRRISQYYGTTVLDSTSGKPIGRCEYIALNPGDAYITGFKMTRTGIFKGSPLVARAAVKVFGDVSIIIDPSEDHLLQQRVQSPIGHKVCDSSGGLMGYISDCVFDPQNGRIIEFIVRHGVYDDWAYGRTAFRDYSVSFLSDEPIYITDYSRLKGVV
jgi:uncharacterized protein YrrD